MKKKLLLPTLLCAFFYTSQAQVPQYIDDSLQNVLEIYQGSNSVPGISAAVNIYDVGTWTGTSGESFENNPLTPDMLLGIGSNTKLFTAVLMIKLSEKNLLSLDDHLYDWLPAYPNIDTNTTIKQLLRHNSGIADYWTAGFVNVVFANPDSVWTPEDVLNFVGPPLFAPGAGVAYSNTNFTLAGMIIEQATGQSWADLIRDSILDPLELINTFVEGFEQVNGISAHPWHLGEDVSLIPRTAITTSAFAVGCIKSTTSDMVKWYDHLFNGDFLSESAFEKLTDFINLTGATNGVGCGIFRMNYNSKTYYFHSGNIRGYSSYTLYDTEDHHSISILRNDTFINAENVAKALANALNVLIITGEQEMANEMRFDVFPNPCIGSVVVNLTLHAREDIELHVLDATGRLIKKQSIRSMNPGMHRIPVELGDFPAGVYFINISSRSMVLTRKMIKTGMN